MSTTDLDHAYWGAPDVPSEWDYRAPTLAEQVDHLRHTWDGPRCPHGQPLNAPGPDLICNGCEAEADEQARDADLRDALDRGEPYPFRIGPVRGPKDESVLWGFGVRHEVEQAASLDDCPF